MEALAGYGSEDENNDRHHSFRLEDKNKLQGDNYENVQMELSEGNSDDSSTPRRDLNKDSSKSSSINFTHHSDRYKNKNERRNSRHDRDSSDRKHHRSDHRDKRRSRSPDYRRRSRSPDYRRRSSPNKHNTSRDKGYKRDERRDNRSSKGRSSPSNRRRSRSRSPHHDRHKKDRRRSRERQKSKSPPKQSSKSIEVTTPEVESNKIINTNDTPTGMSSEMFLASINSAQKLAQQAAAAQQLQQHFQQQSSLVSSGIIAPNPSLTRIQEELQKRRKLWTNKANEVAAPKEASTSNNWEGAFLPKDQDGTMTAKFKRLMGMKGAPAEDPAETSSRSSEEQMKRTDAMLQNMERQYEVARLATHSHRGVGLGFGTYQYNK